MTENEKLRALLAEALDAMHCEDDGDGITSHRCGRCDEFVDRNDKVRDRIKAALAEPVEPSESEYAMHARIRADYDKTVADSWRAHSAKLESERDEARAEVRRTYIELSEVISRNAEAYERGAEAMREAAAQVAHNRAILPVDTATDAAWCRSAACIEGVIRALPLPEDKP